MSEKIGTVTWINGPVVRVRGSRQVKMLEVVEVGEEHLIGEVIGLDDDLMTIQVYEETAGMRPGAPVFGTGLPLSVELGPGLLRSIFDGIQRPLPVIETRKAASYHRARVHPPNSHSIAVTKLVTLRPVHLLKTGIEVSGGAILGSDA